MARNVRRTKQRSGDYSQALVKLAGTGEPKTEQRQANTGMGPIKAWAPEHPSRPVENWLPAPRLTQSIFKRGPVRGGGYLLLRFRCGNTEVPTIFKTLWSLDGRLFQSRIIAM